jgi:hypothetical protein
MPTDSFVSLSNRTPNPQPPPWNDQFQFQMDASVSNSSLEAREHAYAEGMNEKEEVKESGREGERRGGHAFVTWYGLAAGVAVADPSPSPAPAMPPLGKATVISLASTPDISLSLPLELAPPVWSIVVRLPHLLFRFRNGRGFLTFSTRLLRLPCFVLYSCLI